MMLTFSFEFTLNYGWKQSLCVTIFKEKLFGGRKNLDLMWIFTHALSNWVSAVFMSITITWKKAWRWRERERERERKLGWQKGTGENACRVCVNTFWVFVHLCMREMAVLEYTAEREREREGYRIEVRDIAFGCVWQTERVREGGSNREGVRERE